MHDYGWVKLHRKILDSSCFNDPNPWVFKVWCLCMISATHSKSTILRNGIEVELVPGEFLFSRTSWAKRLQIPQSSLRNVFEKLQKWDMIQDKGKDKGLATIYQINNWKTYQQEDIVQDIKKDKVRTKLGQRLDILKNDKNDDNVKNYLNADVAHEIRNNLSRIKSMK